jgi:thiol:disulfide interchange protein DsbD
LKSTTFSLKLTLFFFIISCLSLNSVIAAEPLLAPQSNQSIEQLFGGFNNNKTDELLTPEQAFKFSYRIEGENNLQLSWVIADGYYLYQHKVEVSAIEPSSVQLQTIDFPVGKEKHDEIFGDTVVYYHELFLNQMFSNVGDANTLTLSVTFQGCADIGVCYPPMSEVIQVNLSNEAVPDQLEKAVNPNPNASPQSEQDKIANALASDTLWLTSLTFLGLGLLLSFTPCVLPMIPILSGILVGHGHALSTRKAFLISLSYVTASAVTYAGFGVLAGLFGSNLQATFQNPWIIGSFSFVFVLLALSMFGLYTLQLPAALQTKLSQLSKKQTKQSYLGSAMMGFLSALIVGPCVAAPLAGVLIYIGQTGDATLGGFALFFLGIGMGIPLLLIGASAGKFLPKVGHWMEPIKYFFGVMLLAVAIWLLDRIVPASISLALWGFLLIAYGIYLKATEKLNEGANGWQRLAKSLGILFLLYGIILVIGAASGSKNPLQPLANLGLNQTTQQQDELQFERVKNVDEFKAALNKAAQNNQMVMLDFYADWCVSCKEMEAFTFTNPLVHQALQNAVLLQVDVTENNDEDRTFLKHFNLIGPPAILFFTPQSQGQTTGRVIGYMQAESFVKQIRQALR